MHTRRNGPHPIPRRALGLGSLGNVGFGLLS